MSKALKIIIGLVVIIPLAVIFIVGMYGGTIAKNSINTYGPEFLGVAVNVDDVDFSLLGGELTISGLIIGNTEGFKSPHAFSLGRMHVSLDAGSLFSDHIIIHEIRITAPEVIMELGKGGNNLKALQASIEEKMGPAAEEEETAPAPNVTIEHFYLTDASFQLLGLPAGIKSPEVSLPDIHLENIGGDGTGDDDGTSFGDASNEIITTITAAATSAVASQNIKGLGLDILNKGPGGIAEAKDKLKDIGDKAKKGISSLFGKKKKKTEEEEKDDDG